MTIRRVVPNLKSTNIDANRAFYVDFAGFELAMDMGWIATFVAPGQAAAQISVLTVDMTAPVHPDLTVEVVDVDALYTEAVRRGLTVVYPLTDEPWGVRRFFVADPDGRVVNFMRHHVGP